MPHGRQQIPRPSHDHSRDVHQHRQRFPPLMPGQLLPNPHKRTSRRVPSHNRSSPNISPPSPAPKGHPHPRRDHPPEPDLRPPPKPPPSKPLNPTHPRQIPTRSGHQRHPGNTREQLGPRLSQRHDRHATERMPGQNDPPGGHVLLQDSGQIVGQLSQRRSTRLSRPTMPANVVANHPPRQRSSDPVPSREVHGPAVQQNRRHVGGRRLRRDDVQPIKNERRHERIPGFPMSPASSRKDMIRSPDQRMVSRNRGLARACRCASRTSSPTAA